MLQENMVKAENIWKNQIKSWGAGQMKMILCNRLIIRKIGEIQHLPISYKQNT